MIDIAQLFGQPAISLGNAEQTGSVRGLRFDGNRIVAVDIGDGRTIAADAVRTFEGDALTYEGEAVGQPDEPTAADAEPDHGSPDEALADEALAGELPQPQAVDRAPWFGNPLGTRLLSDRGDALGTLSEMHIGADGVVAEISDDRGHTYEGDRLVTVGPYATIVTPADDDETA